MIKLSDDWDQWTYLINDRKDKVMTLEQKLKEIEGVYSGSIYVREDIEALISCLRLCIEQRDYWATYALDYLKEKHIPRDNQELLKALESKDKINEIAGETL